MIPFETDYYGNYPWLKSNDLFSHGTPYCNTSKFVLQVIQPDCGQWVDDLKYETSKSSRTLWGLVLPEYSIHGLFCIMFLCAQEWLTVGLNIPLLFYNTWRYFHSPTDTKELIYDPASVMNGDTLKFCQKEAWCKLSFFVLSFFYYLYW
ncbi:hypothetical protein CCH79_00000291 [Gambusia affinis]|uniref:Cornichon family AMPA receptor auxiliary protein 3 n=1 Tax=Gambusia affinis TaxID=33528 RepID=A0A315VUV0_GAMAF|nr:hypothetical protein CCH79_00000291 [Gambusia affinis]